MRGSKQFDDAPGNPQPSARRVIRSCSAFWSSNFAMPVRVPDKVPNAHAAPPAAVAAKTVAIKIDLFIPLLPLPRE